MAEPSEGAYALINVATQGALDVYKKSGSYQTWLIHANRSASPSQTWIFDKQDSGWQIACAITWKCIDSKDSKWGQQLSDNNASSQRWTVETDGNTASYGGTTYNTYTLRSKTGNLLIDRSDAWIGLVGSNNTNYARWILVPVEAVSQNASYKIIPAGDVTSCIEIESGSKADSANARTNKIGDKTYQIFSAKVNAETFSTKLINVNSGKALDIWRKSGTPDNVAQWTVNNTTEPASWSQQWLITKVGNVKINGNNVPTFTLRSEAYTGYALTKSGNNICVRQYTGNTDQRFAFIRTEIFGSKLTVPGEIENKLFTRTGAGEVTVSGLRFASGYSMFQARYKLIKYQANRSAKTETKWSDLNTNASANDGWCASSTYTFKAAPTAGIVTIPISKTITLNNSDSAAVDMVVEVRAYVTSYDNMTVDAHSSVKSTTIKIRQSPTVTLKTLNMVAVPGTDASKDSVAVRAVLAESIGEGCTMLKAHLVDARGLSMSEWVNAGATTKVDFKLGSTLYRLPVQNEKIKVEYSMLLRDDVVTTGSVTGTFNSSVSPSPSINIRNTKSTNGSYTMLIDAPRHDADCCFIGIKFLSGTKLIQCKYVSDSNGRIQWLCIPPLNTDFDIHVYSMGAKDTEVLYGTSVARMEGHVFIWNWGTTVGAKESQFASLMLNDGAPPQQKRTFSADTQFHTPSGRVLPVAFATKNLNIDLSVSGLLVDQDADYQAAGPIPPHESDYYLIQLVELSGQGIHPIYRNPYGDWYQVAISSVDVGRTARGYSEVNVTQRAMED